MAGPGNKRKAPGTHESNHPIRVLRVIARMNIGGPALHVSLLSGGLNRAGYENLLVAGTGTAREGNLAELARQQGVRTESLPLLGREISPLRDPVCLAQLRQIVKKFRPQIVHTHTAKAGFIGRTAALLEGVPVLAHTFHGHVLSGYFGFLKERLFRWIESFLAARTHLLITVSEGVANDLARLGVAPREKFSVLPLGLPLEEFIQIRPHGELKQELGLPAAAILVGAVGRLVPVKNLCLLVEAVALLSRREPRTHLVLIGDGEDRENLQNQAHRLGIAGKVHFPGWRRDLAKVYGGLDVVALSSINEGTPVSLIEAVAAGRPVVATSVGGVPEVLENGNLGILVPSGDSAALAEGLRQALARGQTLGEEDRRRVVARYAPERLVREMDSLYRAQLACCAESGLR